MNEKIKEHYNKQDEEISDKVNLNVLLSRMKNQQKIDKKNNLILSVAAVSAVSILGLILTL